MKAIVTQNCVDCGAMNKSVFNESQVSIRLMGEQKKSFSLQKGEYLFKEGSAADGVYCIKSGRIFIYKNDAKGRQHLLTDASNGELLGIAAVTDSTFYGTSARAAEDTDVCFIPKNVFLQLIAICPKVSKESLKMLSGKLNKLDHI